jgi:predicted ATPase/class 3 adenylate cyclase
LPEEAEASATLDGERKTVTVLFADIKGSMDLMEDLDPEEARAIVDPALKQMMEAVQHYGGYVAQSTGDGIFALFGAPVAHEDHPQRALYAAVRMQEELKRYSDRIRAEGRLPIQARVGVNAGEVVVRSITTGEGRTDYAPVGHSTGIAARMQALAPVGSIAATETVRKLCEGYFLFKSLGPTKVKGVSEPLAVYEVTGLGPLRTRLQRAAARGYTKFVGREREMDAMKHAAELAKTGHGQIVAAMADAGVGKSRLFFEFKATSQSGGLVLDALSLSHDKATAYVPLINLLHVYFRITPDDDARIRREKVAGKIAMLDRSLEQETLPHLFALLGIVEGEDPLAQMDPQVRRRRTQDAVKRILFRESLNQPLMVIFEDLHWIDEETQAFLNLFVEGMANAPVLLLVNYRPEYTHPWGSKTYYTQLRLDPLGKAGAEEMLSTLLGDGAELAPLKRIIIDKTDGNPLFMEEIFQALLEDGSLKRNGSLKLVRPVEQLRLPPTVQGILAARIDRLRPEEKELLQTLAVIGSEFPLSLVRQVAQLQPDQLDGLLSKLQTAEFIYEQPAEGDVEYRFKHALTRQVADESLLSQRRKLLHERTARAIEELYSERLEDHYGELARHYLLSNDAAKAIRYAYLAAEQARDRAAYTEADHLVDAGLHLLDKLPEGEGRLRAEIGLRDIESVLAFVLHGASSTKRERAIRRFCEIAERLGEQAQLLRGLASLSSLHFVRGEAALGLEVAKRCLELRELARDPELLADIYVTAAASSESCGKLREAVEHYEAAAQAAHEAVRVKRPLSPTWGLLQTSMITAQSCMTLQLLGRVDQAAKASEEALSRARSSQHLFTLAQALLQAGILPCFAKRETEKISAYAEEVGALAEEMGFAEWRSTFQRGWALAELGDLEKGVAGMEMGVEEFKRRGGIPRLPIHLAWLANGYARLGQTDRALILLDQILADAERSGTVVDNAEILRIKGEVLLMRDRCAEDAAESCFRSAIEIAQGQEAKWWELRATTSLARLLRDTNRRDEARAMLAEIYNWFTEGFDTADLKDAKALLDELSA